MDLRKFGATLFRLPDIEATRGRAGEIARSTETRRFPW